MTKKRKKCIYCDKIILVSHEDLCQRVYPNVEKRNGGAWVCKLKHCKKKFSTQTGIYIHASAMHKDEMRYHFEKTDNTDDLLVLVDKQVIFTPTMKEELDENLSTVDFEGKLFFPLDKITFGCRFLIAKLRKRS